MRKNNEIGLKGQMKIQLATVIGGITFVPAVFLICEGFSLYKKVVLLTGGKWTEPGVIEVLVAWPLVTLAALAVAVTVRWWLIYRWVALKEEGR